MPADLKDLHTEVQKLINAAYARGFEDGGIAMRDNILNAAKAPMAIRPGSVAMAVQVTQRAPAMHRPGLRAPRGLSSQFIREELTKHPGQTIVELEAVARVAAPELGKNTVGNQLRKYEGRLYERRGYKWFLMGQALDHEISEMMGYTKSAGEPSQDAPADFFVQTEGR